MPESEDGSANYLVVDTDYDTHSIVYSCGSFHDLFTFDMLWVLARDTELDQATLANITSTVFEKVPSYNLLKNRYFTKQGQHCPYEERYEDEF